MREESSHDIRSSVDNFPHIVFWHSLFTFLTYYAITVVIKKKLIVVSLLFLLRMLFYWRTNLLDFQRLQLLHSLVTIRDPHVLVDCSSCIPWLQYVIHMYQWNLLLTLNWFLEIACFKTHGKQNYYCLSCGQRLFGSLTFQKCIEALIEKNYIECVKNSRDEYSYVE